MNTNTVFSGLIQIIITSSGLILLGAFIAWLLGKHSPRWRHQVWLGVLWAVILLPATVLLSKELNWRWSPDWMRNAHPVMSQAASDHLSHQQDFAGNALDWGQADSPTMVPLLQPGIRQAPAGSESFASNRTAPSPWPFLVLCLWIAGLIFWALRWTLGWRRLRQIEANSSAFKSKTGQACLARVAAQVRLDAIPTVRVSEGTSIPMVLGWRHPIIILPDTIERTLSEAELEQVLTHECAHIQRGDAWVLLLQRLAQMFYWPNPLVYWMNRELEHAREELCDNHVLQEWSGLEFSKTLAKISQSFSSHTAGVSGLSIGFRKHQLVQRIEFLLDRRSDHSITLAPLSRNGSRLFTAACLCLTTFLSNGLGDPQANVGNTDGFNESPSVEASTPRNFTPYPENLELQVLEREIEGEVRYFPWVEDSDFQRVPRALLNQSSLPSTTPTPGRTNGVAVTVPFAKANGITRQTALKINEALSAYFHEMLQLKFSQMQPESENYHPNLQTGGLVQRILEAHTFRLIPPKPQKISAIRARLKATLESVLGTERANALWIASNLENPEHFSHHYTFRLEDLGTQLEIGLHQAKDADFSQSRSGRPFPPEWDQHAPDSMKPILAQWRARVRQSLDDGDEPIQIYQEEHLEDYSELQESQLVHFVEGQPYRDIPKSMIPTLGIPGLNLAGQLSNGTVALLGLTEKQINFVTRTYHEFESRFHALEKKNLHPLDHPTYQYELKAFPNEARALKEAWRNKLTDQLGARRAQIIDALMRTRIPPQRYHIALIQLMRSQGSNARLMRRRYNDPIWLEEGTQSLKIGIAVHQGAGGVRCEIQSLDSNGKPESMSGSFEQIGQPYKHLFESKYAPAPEGAF